MLITADYTSQTPAVCDVTIQNGVDADVTVTRARQIPTSFDLYVSKPAIFHVYGGDQEKKHSGNVKNIDERLFLLRSISRDRH